MSAEPVEPIQDDEIAEDHRYKWEITPNPYSNDFDSFVTDDDQDALTAILHGAEMHLWDSNEPGDEERVLKVKHRKVEDVEKKP